MSEMTQRRPRTWVLWVVRATFALTILNLGVGSISSIWLGKISADSIWWVIYALPQVIIALLAVLICWAPDSRPTGLGMITIMLNLFGMMGALAFWKWPLLVIGALTFLAMRIRPRGKLFILESPPPAGWPRL